MRGLDLGTGRSALILGAHADDIEIGAGATVLRLIADGVVADVTWVVCSGTPEREKEARASAEAFLDSVPSSRVVTRSFRDGFFPAQWAEVKEFFEELKTDPGIQPDLVLTHRRADVHQDHRTVAELTWNTWRDHLVLEYEIPKYEGDLGRPNVYVPLERAAAERKVELLLEQFPSQAHRAWFTADTFWSLLRLRGLECNAPSGFAEGFHLRKTVV
jgi:LmbE family N-acetylglucosaminyl deacetylase